MSGARPPVLVLLHGAMGSAATMQPLVDAIGGAAEVHALDLLGHGGRPVPERLSIEHLADDVLTQLDERSIAGAFLFGYSSGACIALHLARNFPQRFAGVITLAAKYRFDPVTVARWTRLADPARVSAENRRAAALAKLHAPQDWVPVAQANCRMFRDWEGRPPLTPEELRGISLPALMFCSDNDQLVSADEARALGALVSNSRVVFFRGQSHPLSLVPVGAIAKATGDWMREVRSKETAAKT